MHSKQLKYKKLLDKFRNCPPESYNTGNIQSFRWINSNDIDGSFTPLNLIKELPPRLLNSNDLMCKGYGLSMFHSFELAYKKYKDFRLNINFLCYEY